MIDLLIIYILINSCDDDFSFLLLILYLTYISQNNISLENTTINDFHDYCIRNGCDMNSKSAYYTNCRTSRNNITGIKNEKLNKAKIIEKLLKDKFQGSNITMLLESHSGATGEIIYDFDGLVSVKSKSSTYFVNPESIDIFF